MISVLCYSYTLQLRLGFVPSSTLWQLTRLFLAKKHGEPLQKCAAAGWYKHKHQSGHNKLQFPWSLNTLQTCAVRRRSTNVTESAVKYEPSFHHIIMQNKHDKQRLFHCFSKRHNISTLTASNCDRFVRSAKCREYQSSPKM